MPRKRKIITTAAFAVAGLASVGAAYMSATVVETSSRAAVEEALATGGLEWASVVTDGLELILTGTAPSEPARFRAVTRAATVVDAGRIIDAMEVQASRPANAPRFSLEILRNDFEVSVIGLVPGRGDDTVLSDMLGETSTDMALQVTNMVEAVNYPVPDNWEETIRFAMAALEALPRSKISVSSGAVEITGVADSDQERANLERSLNRIKPDGLTLTMDIAAPRPVITPFTLRFVESTDGEARFEACAVDTPEAQRRVLAAAAAAGFTGTADCVIALGVPSARWSDAAAEGIAALDRLGGGALTLSDADVSLVAAEGTDPALFERVVAELDAALPDLFVLSAVLPEPTQIDGTGESDEGPPEFVATLSDEGEVQLRGRLFDEAQEAAVVSYGRALFGVSKTYAATREDPDLPQGWPKRVLAGLDALSRLEEGTVIVQPELVVLNGTTGDAQAEATISRLLSSKLGADADFRIDVTYDERLDPLLNIPTPQECEMQLNDILVQQKLSFAPGEAVIEAAGDGQLGLLADKLEECDTSVFEIGGHTDSQGREESNLALSVSRAEAVRAALISRGVSPSQLVAEGYGEAQPIADNDTEEGREANRRITFTLLGEREAGPSVVTPPVVAPPGDDGTGTDTDEAASDAAAPEGTDE